MGKNKHDKRKRNTSNVPLLPCISGDTNEEVEAETGEGKLVQVGEIEENIVVQGETITKIPSYVDRSTEKDQQFIQNPSYNVERATKDEKFNQKPLSNKEEKLKDPQIRPMLVAKDEKFNQKPLSHKEENLKDPQIRPMLVAKDEKFNQKPLSHKKENLKDPQIRPLLAGSVLLNLLLILLIVLVVERMSSEEMDRRRQSDLCLNCTKLQLHPDDDLSQYDVREGNVCCLKDGASYSSMAEKLIERQLKEDLISESPKFHPLYCGEEDKVKSVIKLVGKLVNHPDTGNERYPWLKWDVAIDFHSGDKDGQLTQDGTFITVGRTGIYQIYSNLVFQNKKPEGLSSYSSGYDQYYMHGIYRHWESGSDERLLGGSYSYFPTKSDPTATSSHVGSSYQLKEGDRIGVKVHDVSQVVPSNITNFFGMHWLQ